MEWEWPTEVPPLTMRPNGPSYVVHDANGRVCAIGPADMYRRRVEGWNGLVTVAETEPKGEHQGEPMTAAPAPASSTQAVQVETRINQYIAIRDKLKELDEKQKKEREPLALTLEKLGGWITEFLTVAGVESVKTQHGTAYMTTRSTASLEDPDAFMRHVIGTEAWELLDRRANTPACRDFAEQNGGALPPGVKITSIATVGVRRKPGT